MWKLRQWLLESKEDLQDSLYPKLNAGSRQDCLFSLSSLILQGVLSWCFIVHVFSNIKCCVICSLVLTLLDIGLARHSVAICKVDAIWSCLICKDVSEDLLGEFCQSYLQVITITSKKMPNFYFFKIHDGLVKKLTVKHLHNCGWHSLINMQCLHGFNIWSSEA